MFVLEPSAEVPRDVFHIVATAVAHGQVVVVGQHPPSRSARTLVGDKSPVSRGAHCYLWVPGTTPSSDPTAMDEASARLVRASSGWDGCCAWPGFHGARRFLVGRRVGWLASVREGGANEESDCGRRGGCRAERRADCRSGAC